MDMNYTKIFVAYEVIPSVLSQLWSSEEVVMNSTEELSEFLVEKARRELREDETRKRQSLELAREWCLKHPFIRILDPSILIDDILLPFLRSKKYTMDKFYESIESATLFVKRHENWSDWRGENLKRLLELYDSGFITVCKERDFEGRRIVLCSNKFDMTRFNADDIFRLHVLLFTSLHQEEATQIAGAIYIDDFTDGITMNYLSMFPLKHIYEFAVQLKSTPVRLQHILVIGLPSFANHVMNMVKLGFTETMNKRLQGLNDFSEVSNYVDMSLLPKENGGKIPRTEMLEAFKPWMLQCAEMMSCFFDNIEVDFNRVEAYKGHENEDAGSFRKLEID